LILAANLPDIDSFVARFIGAQPQSAHRGFTHGIGGVPLMALLATVIVLAWDKWRPTQGQPVRAGWLLLVAYLGALTHPLLDLMNTYGVRLLEPVSHGWFYADTLFIMDPWIWIAAILGLEFS